MFTFIFKIWCYVYNWDQIKQHASKQTPRYHFSRGHLDWSSYCRGIRETRVCLSPRLKKQFKHSTENWNLFMGKNFHAFVKFIYVYLKKIFYYMWLILQLTLTLYLSKRLLTLKTKNEFLIYVWISFTCSLIGFWTCKINRSHTFFLRELHEYLQRYGLSHLICIK